MSEVSGMYKIAVLGERESVMGFAALGLAVFPEIGRASCRERV